MAGKPLGLSVRAAIRDADGRCLVLRRGGVSASNVGKWELPGGKAEAGEPFDEALVREVAEETDPADVVLLGIDGGRIAATEYRMALALGARVLVIEHSGREADKLLADKDWHEAHRLQRLAPDAAALNALLRSTPR